MMNLKLIAGAVIATIVIGLAGSVYYYRKHSEELAANLAVVKDRNDGLNKAIEAWAVNSTALEGQYNEARQKRKKITDSLKGHDVGKLLAGHPELTLRALNNGTASLFNVIGCSSDPTCQADAAATGAAKP